MFSLEHAQRLTGVTEKMAAKSDIVFTGVKDEHFKLFSATGATGTQVQYNKSYLSYFRTFRPSLQDKNYSKRGDKT